LRLTSRRELNSVSPPQCISVREVYYGRRYTRTIGY
jgi:hypothetical protein